MLSKLRRAMGHRDTLYRLSEIIELDDALGAYRDRQSEELSVGYLPWYGE